MNQIQITSIAAPVEINDPPDIQMTSDCEASICDTELYHPRLALSQIQPNQFKEELQIENDDVQNASVNEQYDFDIPQVNNIMRNRQLPIEQIQINGQSQNSSSVDQWIQQQNEMQQNPSINEIRYASPVIDQIQLSQSNTVQEQSLSISQNSDADHANNDFDIRNRQHREEVIDAITGNLDTSSPEEKIEMLKKQIVQEILFHFVVIWLFGYHIYLNRKYLWKILGPLPSCFYFVTINLLLYVLCSLTKVGLYIAAGRLMNQPSWRNLDRKIKQIEHIEWNTKIALSIYGFWGMSIIYSSKFRLLIKNDPKFENLYIIVTFMVWFRVVFVFLIGILIFFMCFLLILTFYFGQRQISVQHKNTLRRLPYVQQFLKQRAKTFDPAKHDNDMCCICLEEFKTNSNLKIVQLKCNKKHIYHAKCLKIWVRNNDICPMCREPIIRQ